MDSRRSVALASFLLTLALAGLSRAEAQMVAEDSWWHVGEPDKRWFVQPVFSVDAGTAQIEPEGTSFVPILFGGGVRAGYAIKGWLTADAAIEMAGGVSGSLFGDGETDFLGVRVSGGATFHLPLRFTPYAGARIGYSHFAIDWIDRDNQGNRLGAGADAVNAFFVRPEAGVMIRIIDTVVLAVGMHAEVDLFRSVTRNVAERTNEDYGVGAKAEAAGLRSFGGRLSLQVRF